jgi:long-chain acyl-CoA synthetase
LLQRGIFLQDTNAAETFVRLSKGWEDRAAIVSPRLTLTYGEVVARAARSARMLRGHGVGPGANVGIAVRDSGEAIVLMLSLWMLGAVPVPIDFRAKPAERARLVHEFNLIAILEDRQVPESIGYASILVDDTWTSVIAQHDGAPFFETYKPAPALISLTSGTTGRPLGIVLGHEQLLFRLASNLQLGPRRPGGRLLNPMPVSSSGPRNQSLSQLFDGGVVYFHPPLFSAGELAEAVLSKAATAVCVVPTILRGLLELDRGRGSPPPFAHLDLLYCFGAPILPEEKRRARSELCEHFVESYSSSASGRISVLYGTDIDTRPETVGRVLPHVELQIVDGDDQPLPIGAPGAIRVRSPAMAHKIYDNATRADGDRIKEGWVYPGDIGAVDEAGFLCLLGRTSDVIIRGGVNVHPSEVEVVIAEHAGVREVAVVGFAKSREGEEIAAFIVPSGNLTEAALVAHCRAHLSPDKRPRKFAFVTELPRNATGKISRAKLRQQLENAD